MEALELLLAALAAYRATRLLTADRIGLPARRLVDRLTGERSTLGYWVRCPWCVGMYTSAGAVAALDYYRSVPLPAFAWLACATVVGVVATVAG